MTSLSCELTWVRYLLNDMGVEHPLVTTMYYNNKVIMCITSNHVFYEISKYIQLDCHLVRKKLESERNENKHVGSKQQLVKILA